MFRFNLCVPLLATALVAIACQPAVAVVIYAENFEGATIPQSILDPPINWTNEPGDWGLGVCDVPITQGSSPLNATKVMDGPAASGPGLAAAWHEIASPTDGMVYTFTADAWFTNAGSGVKSNSTIGVISSDSSVGDGLGWTNDDGATIRGDHWGGPDFGLVLDLTGLESGDHSFGVGVGVEEAIKVTIELDLFNDIATGIVDNGIDPPAVISVPIVNPAKALLIDRVMTIQRADGVAVDNILVESSPAPDSPPRIPGDADNDGDVDADDAAILAGNWLQNVAGGYDMGDFDEDGYVDDIDATLMATNWGVGTAAAVPEPSTIGLLLMLGAFGVALRQRYR